MRAAAIAALVAFALPAPAMAQGAAPATPPLRLAGFADFGYLTSDRSVREGFLGGLAFAELAYEFADRWTFFGELSATAAPDHIGLSIERLLVRFDATDAVALTLGRFHTPITYWNETFPRGAWGWAPIKRPAMLEGAISPGAAPDPRGPSALLPTHSLGIRLDGRLDAGAFEVGATAGVAASRSDGIYGSGDVVQEPDAATRHAWLLGLHARPDRLPKFRAGGAVYVDRLATPVAGAVHEWILTGHLAWEGAAPELIAEFTHVRHQPKASTTIPGEPVFTANAFYAQLAYRLPDELEVLTPYLRYERIATNPADPVYAPAPPDRRGVAAGVRYDFLQSGALKVEYGNERFVGPDRFSTLRLQASFRLRTRERPMPVALATPVEVPDTAARPDSAAEPAAVATAVDTAPRPLASKSAPRAAPEPPRSRAVAVVVHPDTRVTDLSLPELRRIFRGEQQRWPDGQRIVLLIRSPLPVERDVVLGRIYQMDETELRQFWLGKAFNDTSRSGPKSVSDVATARTLLAALPGAIAFLPADEVGPELRVIRIDGKLPGEDGYPLQ